MTVSLGTLNYTPILDKWVRPYNPTPYTQQVLNDYNTFRLNNPEYFTETNNVIIPDVNQPNANSWWNTNFGWNLGTAKLGLDAGTAILGALNALKANNLAKDQLDFTKAMGIANYNNTVRQWNQQVGDRGASRGYFADMGGKWKEWIDANNLKEWGK